MQTHQMLGILLLTVVTGCTGLNRKDGQSCQPGSKCSEDGVLAIDGLWQASLERSGNCIALGLPDSFYKLSKSYDGKHAFIIGDVFRQPSDPPGKFSYGYEVDGMHIRSNLCAFAMIVREIRTQDGSVWKSSLENNRGKQ